MRFCLIPQCTTSGWALRDGYVIRIRSFRAWVVLIMSDKNIAENYIEHWKNQYSIIFCNTDFQNSSVFSVLFSATNFHSVKGEKGNKQL